MSKNYESVRKSFYGFLQEQEIVQELFNCYNDSNALVNPIEIEEKKNKNKTAKLQKVIIEGCDRILEFGQEIERIWRIDLEKEIEGLEGFKTGAKTTEIALLVLKKRKREKKYTLYVILIELKTTLTIKESLESGSKKKKHNKAGELRDIANKFRCSINRMCMLLTLNDHKTSNRGFKNDNIIVEFKGIVFYNTDTIDESKIQENSDDEKMYNILKQKSDLLTLKTIIDPKDKIQIKFIKNADSTIKPESMSIKLQELLSKLNITSQEKIANP